MSTAGSCRKCAHGNEREKEGRNGRRRSKGEVLLRRERRGEREEIKGEFR
jgi:hypothetical protein